MLREPLLIEDTDWRKMSAFERVTHYLSTSPELGDYRERSDFWDDIIGVRCAGYNSAVDEHIIIVLERMAAKTFFASELATELGWPDEYAELISYLICSAGLAEYGTSPRGAWLNDWLIPLVPKLVERMRAQWDAD